VSHFHDDLRLVYQATLWDEPYRVDDIAALTGLPTKRLGKVLTAMAATGEFTFGPEPYVLRRTWDPSRATDQLR
jgi:hypothetical protein